MSTSIMTITVKTQCYTQITLMMGLRGNGMRPLSTSPITANIFSIIVKGRVVDLLIPTSTSFTTTSTIDYLIFINTI